MTFLLRFGAISGAVCGLLLAAPAAIEALTGETAGTSFVLGIAPAAAPPLITAVQLSQFHAAGRLGVIGYAVNLIGLGLFGGAAFTLNMALFYLDQTALAELLAGPTRLALQFSAAVFVIGTVLFGVSMLRARVHRPVLALAYGVTLPVFALLAPLPDTVFTSALHVLVGVILVWLSRSVWTLTTQTSSARSGSPELPPLAGQPGV